ncbi:MAG: hypothetical protein L0228_13230 [Planctomycetes bacterium]|nr:hypothetical protein [Planctomycetota bacterium]
MSSGSPKLARREQAIEATRRRLRRLEIEAHRIKAELARLEAEYEDDVADWLSRKVRRRTPAVAGVCDPGPASAVAGVCDPGPSSHSSKTSPIRREPPPPHIVSAAVGISPIRGRQHRRSAANYRKAASPLLCSFVLHAIVLSLCLTFTIATLVQQEIPLLAAPADLDEITVEEFSDVEIPATKFDDPELQNVVYETSDFNISDNKLSELEPAELGAGTQPLGEIGQLDALPSELGTLMAGAGSPGRGASGGPPGEAVFFGARSKGDRFVFVVDNSSSMKGGRLEAAIAELLNATNALTPRQSFYVIFVSDRTYGPSQ